ncbi:MAG: nucleotide-diphospho-sugar transferase [Chloroflexota bacterium]
MERHDGRQSGSALRTPVLLLVFNRPESTERVFEAIRRAGPERLYVAADGPRSPALDGARCAEVRELVSAVDWPCEVSTLFRDDNLGCRRAVSSALDWFFELESEGIVLEDDCLPTWSFFPFAAAMLDRHRLDDRVSCVSGDRFHPPSFRPVSSYSFSRHAHIWGWASWRRAWTRCDHNLNAWPALRESGWLGEVSNGLPGFEYHWTSVFDRVRSGEIDSWAYPWLFTGWVHGSLTVLPSVNLVENIGFGPSATHTTGEGLHPPAETLPQPYRHPEAVVPDDHADRWAMEHVFNVRPAHRTALRALRARMRSAARFVGGAS